MSEYQDVGISYCINNLVDSEHVRIVGNEILIFYYFLSGKTRNEYVICSATFLQNNLWFCRLTGSSHSQQSTYSSDSFIANEGRKDEKTTKFLRNMRLSRL